MDEIEGRALSPRLLNWVNFLFACDFFENSTSSNGNIVSETKSETSSLVETLVLD